DEVRIGTFSPESLVVGVFVDRTKIGESESVGNGGQAVARLHAIGPRHRRANVAPKMPTTSHHLPPAEGAFTPTPGSPPAQGRQPACTDLETGLAARAQESTTFRRVDNRWVRSVGLSDSRVAFRRQRPKPAPPSAPPSAWPRRSPVGRRIPAPAAGASLDL